MATETWVVNASPLILLGKAGRLELLGTLAERVAAPKAVIAEIGAKPDGQATLQRIREHQRFVVIENETPPPRAWPVCVRCAGAATPAGGR